MLYSCTEPLAVLKAEVRGRKWLWSRVTDPFFQGRGRGAAGSRREYLNVTLGFLFRAKQYFLFIPLFLYDVATGRTVCTTKHASVRDRVKGVGCVTVSECERANERRV